MKFGVAFVVSAIGLAAGCTSSEPAASPPDAPSPAPVETEPTPLRQGDGAEYFLAVVSQTGISHCPNGHDREWLDVQPVLGWIPVSGGGSEGLDDLMGKPVLARGAAGPAPPRPPVGVDRAPCPVMQMRSDWRITPQGVRHRRGESPAMEHFHMTSLRPLTELSVERAGETMRVAFENPLPFALEGVRLRLHYEGCYGKPGTTALDSDATKLGPGEVIEHEFPIIAERAHSGPRKGGPPAKRHLANSIELRVAGSEAPEGAAVWVDLDVWVDDLGVELACP